VGDVTLVSCKRLLDLVIAGGLLCVLSPLMLMLYGLIRVFSPGPAIYRQTRVGYRGQYFWLLKFRSMRLDADKIGGYQTVEGDTRITPIGRLLRRTSLDELPQLINVLRGDMSLVGPRPDTPMQESRYAPWQWEKRLSVKPGLTGLAQATRRSLANHDERLSLDFAYIDHHTCLGDLRILWLTLFQLTGPGTN
jgi:lipopolysaccharide/colanic/teichoic acid biosynthesis glycosyltransferase